jgi:hypothetical protein
MFFGQNQSNRTAASGDPLLGTFDTGRNERMMNFSGSTNSFASLPVNAFFNNQSQLSTSSPCRVGDNISIQDAMMGHTQRVSANPMGNAMGGSMGSFDPRKGGGDAMEMRAFQGAKDPVYMQDGNWQTSRMEQKPPAMPSSMFDVSFDKSSSAPENMGMIEPAAASVAAAVGRDLDSDQSSGIPDDEPLPLD